MGLSYGVDALVASLLERGVPFPRMMFSSVALLALGLPVSMFTNTLAEAVGGATLGKLAFGQRVRMIDGRRCTVGAALKRSILYPVDAFFFGMVAYGAMRRSGMNQRYGDIWADTVVVRTSAIPGESRFDQRAVIGAFAAIVASIIWDAVTDLQFES